MDIPRDRGGSFEPQLIAMHQLRLPGFDDKVIPLHARGLPVREIQQNASRKVRMNDRNHYLPKYID